MVRPVLIGGATKLPFLWVLLGILGGVETWGLLGLSALRSASLMLLWRELVNWQGGSGERRAGSGLRDQGARCPVPVPIALVLGGFFKAGRIVSRAVAVS